jgi:hypothetical protein
MQVLPATPQIDDRVTHELAGAVIGSLAAAVDREERMGKMGSAAQARLIRRSADGVNRFVFQQKQFVA